MNPDMSQDKQTLARLRLLQFLSPTLPVGGFSYSQGLEWAVEAGWISDNVNFKHWIEAQLHGVLAEQELPLLIRLKRAVSNNDHASFEYWSQLALALRDTAELRKEELARATAYIRILEATEPWVSPWTRENFEKTPLAAIAYFACINKIETRALLEAYAYVWLETSIVNGVKIIPLGQSAGQSLLFNTSPKLITAIDRSMVITDDCVGHSLPALSHASCRHETQYSRVYRS